VLIKTDPGGVLPAGFFKTGPSEKKRRREQKVRKRWGARGEFE